MRIIIFACVLSLIIILILFFSKDSKKAPKKIVTDYFSNLVKSSRTPQDKILAKRNLGETPILTINLPRSVSRRKFMQDQADYYNVRIIFIEGVEGSKMEGDIKEGRIPYGPNFISFINNDTSASKGEIGCVLAHIQAIKYIKDNNLNYALITEDDTSFDLVPLWDTNIEEIIREAPVDWDMIYLYYSCSGGDKDNTFFSYTKYSCWSNAAYLVSRKGAEKIIQNVYDGNRYILNTELSSRNRVLADMYLPDMCNAYCYHKKLFITNNDMDSMNSTIHTDHTGMHLESSYKSLKPYYDKIIESRSVPKVIHIINPVSEEVVVSWKNFTEKNREWMIKIWTDSDLNSMEIKKELASYEILYKYGGMLVDSGTIWNGQEISENNISGMFNMKMKDGKVDLSWLCSVPHHPLLKLLLVSNDHKNEDMVYGIYREIRKYLHPGDVNIVNNNKDFSDSIVKIGIFSGQIQAMKYFFEYYLKKIFTACKFYDEKEKNIDFALVSPFTLNIPAICPKILWSGEPHDFSIGDYEAIIDTKKESDLRKNVPFFYLPFYVFSFWERRKNKPEDLLYKTKKPKTKFCAYLYSHKVDFREKIKNEISKYKQVDDLSGKEENKIISSDETYNDKAVQVYSDYKFVICSENSVHNGYITEKIISAMLAGAIPIYYGAPDIKDHFNFKSFLIINEDMSNLSEILEKIEKIDSFQEEYNKIFSETWMKENKLNKYFSEEYITTNLKKLFEK